MFHATSDKSNVLSQNSCTDNIHRIKFNLLMAPYLSKLSTICTLGLYQSEVIYNIWGQGCRVTGLGSWCEAGKHSYTKDCSWMTCRSNTHISITPKEEWAVLRDYNTPDRLLQLVWLHHHNPIELVTPQKRKAQMLSRLVFIQRPLTL